MSHIYSIDACARTVHVSTRCLRVCFDEGEGCLQLDHLSSVHLSLFSASSLCLCRPDRLSLSISLLTYSSLPTQLPFPFPSCLGTSISTHLPSCAVIENTCLTQMETRSNLYFVSRWALKNPPTNLSVSRLNFSYALQICTYK